MRMWKFILLSRCGRIGIMRKVGSFDSSMIVLVCFVL